MQTRNIKILGTGKYLPGHIVTAEEIAHRLGVTTTWVTKTSDVAIRHFVKDETAAEMGAIAAKAALANANLTFDQIDCLVCTSGTMEQPIPSTASLIQKAMGAEHSGVPAFDINSTCLSFITGLDVISYLVHAGRYKKVLLVATEIASIGLDWSNKESSALFGDGAAAVVIGQTEQGGQAKIVHADMRTYSKGAHMSEIRGGGTKLPARQHTAETAGDFLFRMDGQAIFRLASQILPGFVAGMLQAANCSMEDIDLVVPHQGSAMAMRLLRKRLGIAKEQLMYITPTHGNTIAASVPMGIHEAIVQGRMKRGDRIMLLGTSAGLSVGGIILDY